MMRAFRVHIPEQIEAYRALYRVPADVENLALWKFVKDGETFAFYLYPEEWEEWDVRGHYDGLVNAAKRGEQL